MKIFICLLLPLLGVNGELYLSAKKLFGGKTKIIDFKLKREGLQ